YSVGRRLVALGRSPPSPPPPKPPPQLPVVTSRPNGLLESWKIAAAPSLTRNVVSALRKAMKSAPPRLPNAPRGRPPPPAPPPPLVASALPMICSIFGTGRGGYSRTTAFFSLPLYFSRSLVASAFR